MNRQYNLKLDLQFRCNNSTMKFNQFDVNTSDFFMRITNANKLFSLDDAIVTLVVIKPDNTVQAQFVTVNDGIVYADLESNLKDIVGVYKAKAMLVKADETVITDVVEYEVLEDRIISQLNERTLESNEIIILNQMLARLAVIESNEDERKVNELARVSSEEARKLSMIKIIDDINKLIQDTKKDINDYKNTKDTEINSNLNAYKVATTNSIEDYKNIKDNEISSNLNEYKQNTTTNINNTVTQKMSEVDGKIVEVNQAKADMESTVSSKIVEADNKIVEVNQSKDTMISEVEKVKADTINKVDAKIVEVDNSKNSMTNTVNAKVIEVNNKIVEVDKSKADMINKSEAKIVEVENRFNTLTSSQQQSSEVIDAREGQLSLKANLNRIETNSKQIFESVEGNFITVRNSVGGYIQDLEVMGNTYQDENDLSIIKSVGTKQEDGQYKLSILSSNKNLLNTTFDKGNLMVNNADPLRGHTTNRIKVGKNKNITVSFPNGYGFMICAVNENNTEIASLSAGYMSNNHTVNTGNYEYVGIQCKKVDNTVIDFDVLNKQNNQLEEGTVATSYTQRQENKSTILLPCQLEKVGNVADRLYWDKGEKAWCVDKNVLTHILKASDFRRHGQNDFRCSTAEIINKIFLIRDKQNIISNKYEYNNRIQCYEKIKTGIHVYYHSDAGGEIVVIDKSTDDLGVVSAMLNNSILKFIARTPQKIVLPLSTQIQLNSLLDTTHVYTTDTEVEATIKAKVSKSTSASIESLNVKTDILTDRVEAIEGLKESQDLQYSTDKGYLVCENTKNGVVKDMVINGKTLVNLYPKNYAFNGNIKTLTRSIVGKKDFTFKFKTQSNAQLNYKFFYTDGTNGNDYKIKEIGAIGSFEMKFPFTKADKSKEVENISFYWVLSTGGETLEDVVFVEGDYNGGYFEGIKSVGEDTDKIEVLSSTKDLKVVLNESSDTLKYQLTLNKITENNYVYNPLPFGVRLTLCTGSDQWARDIYINGNSLASYTLREGEYIRYILGYKDVGHANVKDLHKVILVDKYDKKAILYQDKQTLEWKKPILHEWDIVDDKVNKWYKRSAKVVLNGSENDWRLNQIPGSVSTLRFGLHNNISSVNSSVCFSDLFTYKNTDEDFEHIKIGEPNSPLFIYINKSKLETPDVAGFKKWLQANNVSVVYQLRQEEVYDTSPLNLSAYADKTMICCSGSVINPGMEFAITSHLPNMVLQNRKSIDRLEDNVFKYMVTQNRLQLKSTYRADKVTFKVDTSLLLEEESKIEVDNDLFLLLKNNVLVGIENYSKVEMEAMIDFYALVGKITWEMWDEIWLIIDMQHNPLVEETLPAE